MMIITAIRNALMPHTVWTQHAGAAAAFLDRVQSHCYASTSTGSSSTGSSSSSDTVDAVPPADQEPHQPQGQSHLVDTLLSPANMSRRQQLLQRKSSIMQEYQRAPGDTGSPEVQIAVLTERIRDMTDHIVAHKKDHVSKRGLQGMLNQRRKLLSYLRRDNFPRYAFVIHKLGLKDTYAKQERYDKYRVGTRLGTSAEPLKRYGSH